ncbi:hypothetical protein ACFLSZ_04675 [Candidatus Bipolaricaulota bacterium]
MSSSNSTILIIAGIGVALIALLLLLGSGPEQPTESGVSPPPVSGVEPYMVAPPLTSSALVVHAGLDRTVGERETIKLSGEGYDPRGLPVTYAWTAEGGLGFFENAHSPTTSYTAPSACDCDDYVILTLTVTSNSGASISDQMVIMVRDPLTCTVPTYETSGYYVTVPTDVCQDDTDAPCPPTPSEPCESPCISEAPADGGCPVPPIPCPCIDAADCTEPWQTGWPLDGQPGHPKDRAKPSIGRHFPREMNEGRSITLQGYVRNPACQSVCFTWLASKGWLENTNTLTPIYHAPESDRLEGETVTISLIVYGAAQGRSYDQIRIKIRNTNPG